MNDDTKSDKSGPLDTTPEDVDEILHYHRE